MRHRIFSDGISYLDIAGYYAVGNWNAALNAYWSPLYSWLLALAFLVLHPGPYWQVATLHLVNFLAYASGLLVFYWFLRELLEVHPENGLSRNAIYIAGYTSYIYAGLYLINIGYCSPDMIAMVLTLALATLTLRMFRVGPSAVSCAAIGIIFGLFYLARTAFAALSPVFLLAIVLRLIVRGNPWVRPAFLIVGCYLLTAGPFLAALWVKEGRFTIGESGNLNYGWEVSGAARSIHWQGEPYDIGVPVHPTKLVIQTPSTYVFGSPVLGTYPPWYDPSYWYQGIRPKLRLQRQVTVLASNASFSILLLLRSPVFLPCILLAVLTSFRRSWSRLLSLWPVLLPSAAGIALYCLVFVDKRYIAGFLLVIWGAVLVGVDSIPAYWRSRASLAFQAICLLFLALFIVRKLSRPIKVAMSDLVHGREAEHNLNDTLAKRFQALGLKPGDKIAYIGLGINADWARLDKVRIVSEIPVRYVRPWTMSGSCLRDDPESVSAFWHASPATREKVFQAFRAAGAKIVVTDGLYSAQEAAAAWPSVLLPGQDHLPFSGGEFPDQESSRFYRLTP